MKYKRWLLHFGIWGGIAVASLNLSVSIYIMLTVVAIIATIIIWGDC